jgi:hypothetical protein
VLYFRPVLDPHDDMVDVPVLPSGLRQGALAALHYDPLMCHPSGKALFALSWRASATTGPACRPSARTEASAEKHQVAQGRGLNRCLLVHTCTLCQYGYP